MQIYSQIVRVGEENLDKIRKLRLVEYCFAPPKLGRGPYPASRHFYVRTGTDHLGVSTASILLFVSVVIAAAPRPLRLRRGFVVTTALLNDILIVKCYYFLLHYCNKFILNLYIQWKNVEFAH